ncbi:MAG TPA: divalent metal cation transporter [Nitrososphaerales archaeon]|nr:divalent metal cation transporter [Nitrososphaerales archaeon]
MSSSRLKEFATSFGPAWIVMIADVDAPSILTAAIVGATYSYGLIWFFLVLIVPLFVIQEASGRVGMTTGKGLGEAIRENYSRRVAALASLPMAVVSVVSYIAEYAGIAVGMEIIGVPPFVSVPIAYVAYVGVVVRRRYLTTERALLIVSAVLIVSYAGSLLARGLVSSNSFYFSASPGYLFLLAASAGAVVMPFMLFYQASATAEKKTTRLWAMRTETLVGAVASELGMIVVAMATSGLSTSLNFVDPKALALALSSLAGAYAPYVFAVGLVAAAFLALVVISLGSSWAIVDTMGWKKESFVWVYVAESVPAVVIPVLYPTPLSLVLELMVVFVFVLVGPGILMGLLSADRRIMGEYASGAGWKAAYWLSLAAVLGFGIAAVVAAL